MAFEIAFEGALRPVEQYVPDPADRLLDALDLGAPSIGDNLRIATKARAGEDAGRDVNADEYQCRNQRDERIDRNHQRDQQIRDDSGNDRVHPRQQHDVGDRVNLFELGDDFARIAPHIKEIGLANDLVKGGDAKVMAEVEGKGLAVPGEQQAQPGTEQGQPHEAKRGDGDKVRAGRYIAKQPADQRHMGDPPRIGQHREERQDRPDRDNLGQRTNQHQRHGRDRLAPPHRREGRNDRPQGVGRVGEGGHDWLPVTPWSMICADVVRSDAFTGLGEEGKSRQRLGGRRGWLSSPLPR